MEQVQPTTCWKESPFLGLQYSHHTGNTFIIENCAAPCHHHGQCYWAHSLVPHTSSSSVIHLYCNLIRRRSGERILTPYIDRPLGDSCLCWIGGHLWLPSILRA